VTNTVLNKVLQRRAGDGKRCACRVRQPQVRSSHIGILFSGVVARAQLAFFQASPDSIISAF